MVFASDAFISYAHLDNLPLVEGQNGWVADFHRALGIRVGQLLGKEPNIWRDPKLDGNDYFADALIERLRTVAVLIPILSPRYIKSEWTRRELTEFCKAASEECGIRVGEKARLFKVLKMPVPLEMHPPEVQPLLGYEFFNIDSETGKVRTWDQVFGAEAQRDFWMKLDDLAHDLCELLTMLETDVAPETVTQADKPGVYLAETTVDLKAEHEAIKRDLRQHGHRVLPAGPLPLVASELKTAIQEQLEQCQLSIHLVGRNYSLVPEGSEESLLEIQNDLAIERSEKSGFTRLLWIPPKLAIEDERQRALVAQLRADPRLHGDGDLLETSFEDLRTLIQTRLTSPSKPARESTELKQLYLIYDSRDQDAIVPWQKYLFDRGFEVIHPLCEGSESEIREYHEENLRICHAVLIYYGAANEAWLRRKIREVLKSAAYGRTEPISAVGILLAAPRTPQKERFQTHECAVIPQWDGFSPEPLLPFIQQIGEKKVRAV